MTSKPTEILLTTNDMVFFLYDLFGHDIAHDAHPQNLGSTRFPETFANIVGSETVKKVSQPLTTSSSSPPSKGGYKGGGDKEDKEKEEKEKEIAEIAENMLVDNLNFLENETNKPIIDTGKKDIIFSVGKDLISKNMLFVKNKRSRSENKFWQDQTFIIIDVERIIRDFNSKANSILYPGNIYYDGKIIPPSDITVNKISSTGGLGAGASFDVIWDNYKLIFKEGNRGQLVFEGDEAGDIKFELVCPKDSQDICDTFKTIYKELGDTFFYGSFTDYMRNETYDVTEGDGNSFVQYILSSKNPKYDNDSVLIKNFLDKIDKDKIQAIPVEELYNAFLERYNNFLIELGINVVVPGLNEKIIDTDVETKKQKNKYLIVLAQIIGVFINLNGDNTLYKEYKDKIESVIQNFSCDPKTTLIQEFLITCTLFIDTVIVDNKNTKIGGQKKNMYNQSGGDYISSIMSREEKDALLIWATDVNSLIPGKWDKFIKTPVVPYDGIEKVVIDAYITGISTVITGQTALRTGTDAFYYGNILNLIFNLPDPNPKDLAFLPRVEASQYNLFNINYYQKTLEFVDEIKNQIIQPATNLDNFEMPKNIQNVMPIFISKVGSTSSIADLIEYQEPKLASKDGTKPAVAELKSDTDKSNAAKAIKVLYDFEQAFIVQFKIFLLYGYTKRIERTQAASSKTAADADAEKLKLMLTSTQKKDFYASFKKNFTNYLKIVNAMNNYAEITQKNGKNVYLKKRFGELSSIQEINSGYIVSSSIAVISYCLKNNSKAMSPPPPTGMGTIHHNEILLLGQINMLNNICLKENLDAVKAAGSIDGELYKVFRQYIQNSTGSYFKDSNPKSLSNPGYQIHDRELSEGQDIQFKKPTYTKDVKIQYLDKIETDAEIMKADDSKSQPPEQIYSIKVGKKTINGVLSDEIKPGASSPPYTTKSKVKYVTEEWKDGEIKSVNLTAKTVTLKIPTNKDVSFDDIKLKTPSNSWVSGKIEKIHDKKKVNNTAKMINVEPNLGNIDVVETSSGTKFKIRDNSQIKEVPFDNVADIIKNKPNAKKLYYISNAVGFSGVPIYFCPYSSIMDGQSTCNSYSSALNSGHPVEEGTINIIVKNGISSALPETMRYHVKVEKSTVSGEWEAAQDGKKIVKISAYLKINDDVLINIGEVDTYAKHNSATDPDWVSILPAISVDLNGSTSPLEAKVCIKSMMETTAELLTNNDKTLKNWDDYLKIIDGTTSGLIETATASISSAMFRRKIIEASFKKSLGDYLQEINSVAENGGYELPTWTATSSTDGTTILDHPGLRLGLGNDRPSGVRAAFLLLFGRSGINKDAIAGYLTGTGEHILAARNKANFKGGSNQKYKIYNNINNKVKNNTKRRKNLTKKQKKLFKNRKISKRNNKGTRKRR
jgi:hypothetical protein